MLYPSHRDCISNNLLSLKEAAIDSSVLAGWWATPLLDYLQRFLFVFQAVGRLGSVGCLRLLFGYGIVVLVCIVFWCFSLQHVIFIDLSICVVFVDFIHIHAFVLC